MITKKYTQDVASSKFHTTIYMTQEACEKLNEMCANNVKKGLRMSKSDIICDAIELLYTEFMKYLLHL